MDFNTSKSTKKEKFMGFIKKYAFALIVFGLILLLSIVAIIIAATTKNGTIVSPETGLETTVSAGEVKWKCPVDNVEILKDYNGTELVYNSSFKRWEAHKAIDFKVAETDKVYAVLSGKVLSVEKDLINGNVVVIEHSNGLKTTYGSLGDDIKVKAGDKVSQGTVIGYGGTSASKESDLGNHLHFEVRLNGKLVDPNSYLKLK